MTEVVNIQNINPITFELQTYSPEDTSLIIANNISTQFNSETDYLEYFIYDLNRNILIENITGYPNFTLIDNQVTIDPEADLRAFGFTEGQYNTVYNFLRHRLASTALDRYYIDQISADRTEIRLNTTTIPNDKVSASAIAFSQEIQNSQGGYLDFYLDFGNNQLVIANNVLLDNSNPNDPTVLIKLYEALPLQFNIKSECWVVEQIAEPVAYNISITPVFNIEDDNIPLKGPNYNLSISDQINNSTQYASLSSLTATTSATGSGSLRYQLNSLLAENNVELNIDYSSYNNFIHFSSAQTRLENFYYKLALIEQYTYSASLSTNTATNFYVSSSNIIYQAKIDEIITNFDGYEYYLYYESGSTAWPKTNNTPPYINASTINPGAGYTWFVSQSAVAEFYDSENNNALVNAIPSYLREDPNNAPYELFVEMIGQHFDNIFSYLQGVTEKYNADNRLNYGVSKDLVADILRDLGIKIYQNNFSTDDLYAALIGITPSGSLYNLPYTTTSLPTPTGFEYIKTYVTASATGSLQPVDDINKSIYKRIYHNLPYILKKKGTVEGLRAIITLYGIPDTILRINEYGGKDKNNSNDWDYWYNQYNYTYTQNGNNFISSSWKLNSTWGAPSSVPATLMFRFKTNGLPTSNIPRSQSLWNISGSSGRATIILTYTGSGYTTSSFISSSASPIDPYYQYAKLDFIPNTASLSISASVYLPFFNGGWWSVMLTSGSNFTLYAKNSIYNGYDGSTLGFQASSSVGGNNSIWTATNTSFFGSASISNYRNISGSFQEIRYYTVPISESVFDDYVMNPNSIEGNGTNQGPNQLAFRASLGGELYTGSTSIHPKVTGSWVATSSFASDSNFYFNTTPVFVSNTQSVFFDQPPVGIKNPVADKIKQQSLSLPYSSSLANIPNNTTLSNVKSIQQDYAISQSYTKDINYVEVAFSPQNEINDDISSQIGYINIGEYIGDPRLVSSSAESYPALNALRNAYFEKYTHNYDINDYVRLIKFIDNSLFKMLQDWTPARASLSSGVVIKQHLLERNKYPVPQITPNTPIAYQGSGSNNITWNTPFIFQNILVTGSGIQMYTITGSNGGSFPNLQGQTSSVILPSNYNFSITQSWSGTTPSVSGSVPFTQSSQIEFFNGELSGSALVVTDGDLNGGNPFLNIDPTEIRYNIETYESTLTSLRDFLNNPPASGWIHTWYNYAPINNKFPSVATGVEYIAVSIVSDNNINVISTLRSLREIIFLEGGIKYTFIIQSRVDNSNQPFSHFLFKILYSPSNNVWGFSSIYSNTLTSLSPYVPIPFVNSDYNSLINNATQDRRSIKYMDVDYVDSQLSPINLQGLLSGSATPAPVQDSNYTLGKQINSRYIGKNLESEKFNQWTPGDVAYGKTPNVSNPRTYFVQFNWLAGTSPEWGNNIVDKTQASIRYIIDENGNRTIPINDPEGINQSIIEQSFAGGNAISQLVNSDAFGVNMSILNGTFSVFKAGKRIVPILYTQTASYYTDPATGQKQVVGFGYTGSISFQDSIIRSNPNTVVAGTVVNDYRLLTYVPSLSTYTSNFTPNRIFEKKPVYVNNVLNSATAIYNSASFNNNTQTDLTSSLYPQSIQFNRPIQLGASASFITSSTAPFTGSLYSFSFSDQATAYLGKAFYTYYFDVNLVINYNLSHTDNQGSQLNFKISLQRRGAGLSNRGVLPNVWYEVASTQVTLSSLKNSSQVRTLRRSLTYTENTSGDGNQFGTQAITYPDYYFKVVVYGFSGNILPGNNLTTGIVQIADGSYFQVRQSPVRDINIPCTQFWMTSSATSSRDVLYARQGTSTELGLNDVINLQQRDIPNSGFDNLLYSFTPQPYDEIRFEGNEDLTFNIVQTTQSLTSSITGNSYQAYTLKLDRDLPFNMNTDYFALRRYIDDPSNIILNVDKPAGGTSGGTLKPEFITTQTERVVKETITNIVDQ